MSDLTPLMEETQVKIKQKKIKEGHESESLEPLLMSKK